MCLCKNSNTLKKRKEKRKEKRKSDRKLKESERKDWKCQESGRHAVKLCNNGTALEGKSFRNCWENGWLQ